MTTRTYQKAKRNIRRSRRIARDTHVGLGVLRNVVDASHQTTIFA